MNENPIVIIDSNNGHVPDTFAEWEVETYQLTSSGDPKNGKNEDCVTRPGASALGLFL